MPSVNIFWFRRDLRLDDNAGLYHALKSGIPVVPIFIYDRNILDKLDNKSDRRVEFIHSALQNMHGKLSAIESSLEVYVGTPKEIFENLLSKYLINAVFTNHDYEPYGIKRDNWERIFEMFFTTTADIGGAGLGLYITKTRIEALKGTIEVIESEFSPIGTTMKITFPLNQKK